MTHRTQRWNGAVAVLAALFLHGCGATAAQETTTPTLAATEQEPPPSNEPCDASCRASWLGAERVAGAQPTEPRSFGFSVAIASDGNTLAVGEPSNDMGVVHVYERSATSWAQVAQLTVPVNGQDVNLGVALALSADGNTLAASSVPDYSVGEEEAAHSPGTGVHIFVRQGSTWVPQARVTHRHGSRDEGFGNSISLSADGNALVVSAGGDSLAAPLAGAVYVFERSGSQWSQTAFVQQPDAAANEVFGLAATISSSARMIAVTSRGSSSTAPVVHVFVRQGQQWTANARLTSPTATPQSGFGSALAFSGDEATLAIGQTQRAHASAHVFVHANDTWTEQAIIDAPEDRSAPNFAGRLALSQNGETLVIGAVGDPMRNHEHWRFHHAEHQRPSTGPSEAQDPDDREGDVFVFRRVGNRWRERLHLLGAHGVPQHLSTGFATSLGLSADGQHLVVGAPSDGGAYAFEIAAQSVAVAQPRN